VSDFGSGVNFGAMSSTVGSVMTAEATVASGTVVIVGTTVVGVKVVVVAVFDGATVTVVVLEETTSEEFPQAEASKVKQKNTPNCFMPNSLSHTKQNLVVCTC